ncbi:CEPT1 [Branchiostoma lanceolatum]|uniref:CEPT1 protein n=1 Tax=Branchiostoma lanceolatum TaxID=7740 RepID=A0A8J9VRB9_BRALA|nr:CEPT1 [Branchiostoma lanceolatum]
MINYLLRMNQPTLKAAQLRSLDEYKYVSEGRGASLLSPLLQPFWDWLEERVPLWVAPNLITLLGLIFDMVPSLLLMYYSPTAREEAPAWVYLLVALGVFLYHTLDHIDGKQARRTGSATPLGNIFDHGCDAISVVLSTIAILCAMKMGEEPGLMFLSLINLAFFFYCFNWGQYLTGRFSYGWIEGPEMFSIAMGIHIVSAVFGPSVWSINVPLIGLTARAAGMLILASLTAYKEIEVYSAISMDMDALSPGLAFLLSVIQALAIYMTSPMALFQTHPCLFLLMIGTTFAKLTSKLIVAHITKSQMAILDSSMIGPGLLLLNQCFNSFVDEYILLWITLIFVTLDLAQYCFAICSQICEHLDIYCFSITSKPSTKGLKGKNNIHWNSTANKE